MKTKKIKTKLEMPKLIKSIGKNKSISNFPLDHYSYSAMVQFSVNPIMFKIKHINGDKIETTNSISSVIGQAFHSAMDIYYSGDLEDPIKRGLEYGMDFLDSYNENFIEFNKTTPTIQKAQEKFAFIYNSYLNELKESKAEIVACEEKLEQRVSVEWRGKKLNLPVPLKGYLDKIIREGGRLKIVDYKTTNAFSNPDKIDGAKILQAVMYYLLVLSAYKEAPYSMIYEEIKGTKNRDGSPQVKRYEIVYEDNEQFFDFFFRFYEDMTLAINGQSVFVPNILSFWDNETAIVAYIHRLDQPEKVAEEMSRLKVENITDLLRAKIEKAGNMRKFLQSLEKSCTTAKKINYKNMSKEEQIKTKLLEHGMILHFVDKIEGLNIDLYRFEPSIGLKMKKIEGYVADIEQVVGKSGVRVLAPIPNTTYVGFEVPRSDRKFIEEKPVNDGFELALGKDVMGDIFKFDIRKAPHLLVAGATGSGKSVFLNSIISQLCKIDNLDLHLFDPKMVELALFKKEKRVVQYQDEIVKINDSLKIFVSSMNKRYKLLADKGVRNIEEYNENGGKMKYEFIVIDEFGDLVVSNYIKEETVESGETFKDGRPKMKTIKTNISKEIEKNILILAQKARACGIHLIIATQRPSVDIITGSIKANFPCKVAFRTAKAIDSQVLLGESGAEKLLGRGDMIFSSDEGNFRLQGYNF